MHPFYHLKTAVAVGRRPAASSSQTPYRSFPRRGAKSSLTSLLVLSPKSLTAFRGPRISSGSAVSESCVACKAFGQDVSCGFELIPDEAEAKEPSPHGVFGVLILLWLGACGAYHFCHLAERQAKLDVAFQLSGVQTAFAFCRRPVEFEKPEFHRAFCEGRMVVEHVVAAVVVMLVSVVARTVAGVPDVRQCRHCAWLSAVYLREEIGVDRAAEAAQSAPVKVKSVSQQAFMARHNVGEVAEGLRRVAVCPDVDVDSASP